MDNLIFRLYSDFNLQLQNKLINQLNSCITYELTDSICVQLNDNSRHHMICEMVRSTLENDIRE